MTERVRPALLLIEDPAARPATDRAILTRAGYRVRLAGSLAEGRIAFAEAPADIVLLDAVQTDGDALALVREFVTLRPRTRIIVMAQTGSARQAVAALRAGAHDFLAKPVDPADLPGLPDAPPAAATPVAASRAAAPVGLPARPTSAPAPPGGLFLGASPAMAAVYAKIRSAAPSMATVFITGESGTGKELCAQAVHDGSGRASGPFIALNCGAIPPDLLESEVFGHMKGSFTGALADKPGAAAAADGGTLFLDEICEMDVGLQTKLLRFLQTSTVQPVGATRPRKVDVRIVCATNRDPVQAVARGQFREDLYYRLYVVPIHMPPLRDRGNDVIEIAEAALARFSAEENRVFDGLDQSVRALFLALPWPGNVRQLLNVIRNVVVLNPGGWVTPAMLPSGIVDAVDAGARAGPAPHGRPPALTVDDLLGRTLAEIEQVVVEATIALQGGSVPRAARMLDVSPSTLYRKREVWAPTAPGVRAAGLRVTD